MSLQSGTGQFSPLLFGPRTRLGGLLGSPVSHSISPLMHNDSFRELGIDAVYLCFDVDRTHLGDVVKGLRCMNTFGFNLTMPNKSAVIEYLDALSDAASLCGAVNTVCHQDGILTGYNTDGIGYMRSVRDMGIQIKGREMTLLGSGGAAQAIAAQAALDGAAAVHIACRKSASWQKMRDLADKINAATNCTADLTELRDTGTLRKIISESILLTNATSLGMSPNEDQTPLEDVRVLHEGLAVSDVIYQPRQTRFLREAAGQGCLTNNGLYMLLYQGAAAFRLWTGKEMPLELIRNRYFRE